MRACWLKWVGRDWSISADYIWLNYSGANSEGSIPRFEGLGKYLTDKVIVPRGTAIREQEGRVQALRKKANPRCWQSLPRIPFQTAKHVFPIIIKNRFIFWKAVTEGGFDCGDATDEQVVLSPDPQVKIAVFKNQILQLRHKAAEFPIHLT